MLSYPALYNGSDTFNNLSGIPIDIVERIEILPGDQSSLYGSDAIAGVVNIILKDHMDGGVLNVRGGATPRVAATISESVARMASTPSMTVSMRWSTCSTRRAVRSGVTSAT